MHFALWEYALVAVLAFFLVAETMHEFIFKESRNNRSRRQSVLLPGTVQML